MYTYKYSQLQFSNILFLHKKSNKDLMNKDLTNHGR